MSQSTDVEIACATDVVDMFSNEMCESKVTFRLFTWSVSAIYTSATASDADCFSLPTLWAVPNIATSDLSGLKAREL